MNFHQNNQFKEIIEEISKFKKIQIEIIEQDYWYAFCCYRLSLNKNVTVKGSYILSKCFDNFDRSPNDLDFSLEKCVTEKFDIDSKKIVIREIIKSISNKIVLCENESSSNQNGLFSYNSISGEPKTIRVKSLVYSPLNRKIHVYRIKTIIYDYFEEKNNIELIKDYPELSFPISVYDKYLMIVDKLLCLFYFTSTEFKGSIDRLFCALYDTSCLIDNILLLQGDRLQELFYEKIQDKFKGNFAYKAYSEFFNKSMLDWNLWKYKNDYQIYLENNNLKSKIGFTEIMNKLNSIKNTLFSSCSFNLIIQLANYINQI